jgi:hypothetical protein
MMLRFGQYLSEAAKKPAAKKPAPATESEGNLNDDKGKLAELALAHHLGKHLNGNPEARFYPSHFREKATSKSPQDVEKEIRDRRGDDMYNAVDRHTSQTADALVDHLIKSGRIKNRNDIQGVHWTSLRDTEKSPGDHEKLTGQKDVNQNGDIILSIRNPDGTKGFVPISSKYGNEDEPNYRNDGLDSLGKKAGLSPDKNGMNVLERLYGQQSQELEDKLGKHHGAGAGATTASQRHALFKQDRNKLKDEKKAWAAQQKEALQNHVASGKTKSSFVPQPFKPSKDAQRAQDAYNISLGYKRRMAAQVANGFNDMADKAGHDGPLRDFISGQVAAPTIHPTIVAHSRTNKDDQFGDAESRVYPESDIAPGVLNNYENIRAEAGAGEGDEEGAISVHFRGRNKKTGQTERIASQALKSGNGPYKGVNGTFKIRNANNSDESEVGPVPDHKVTADSHTGAPVVVAPHVPETATVVSPTAQRVQRFKKSMGIDTTVPTTSGGFGQHRGDGPVEFPPAPPADHKEYASGEHNGVQFNSPGE